MVLLVICLDAGVSNVSPRSANASGSLRRPQRLGGRQWFARQIWRSLGGG